MAISAPREERTEDKEHIVTAPIDPEKSYEIFQGKFFSVLKNKEREKISTESPADKLSRIQFELQQLSNDITKTSSAKSSSKPAEADLPATLKANADRLAQMALQLNAHPLLNSAGAGAAMDSKLKDIAASINNPKPAGAAAPSALSDTSSLERRVSLLESVLGSASNVLNVETVHGVAPKSRVFPLADAILALEQRMALLDEQNLDVLRNKAKALKIELEAVNKVGPAQSPADQKLAAEAVWKKVSDLGDKLKHVEGVADELPALAVRLKTLETVHQAAGSIHTRVADMVIASDNMALLLRSNAEVLETLKKTLKESTANMLANVAAIDARIAAIKKH